MKQVVNCDWKQLYEQDLIFFLIIYQRATDELCLDRTFLSYFLGHISNVEIFDVQLPQVGKLT